MTYLAVLFMCIKADCQIFASETLFKKEQQCLALIARIEAENKPNFDIFEARCIGVKNDYI